MHVILNEVLVIDLYDLYFIIAFAYIQMKGDVTMYVTSKLFLAFHLIWLF